MTTPSISTTTIPGGGRFRFPDPPEPEPDAMTSFSQLSATGNAHHLAWHFGHPETTLVAGEKWVGRTPHPGAAGLRRPDLLIAFGVNPQAYHESNGYAISEQGKPPDFVLEVASQTTGRFDIADKPGDYAQLGIPEYWRFDETGGLRHGVHLAGDRLVRGEYQPIEVRQIAEGVWQGHSDVLDLDLRWDHGELLWYDPHTGEHIATFQTERELRLQAEELRFQAETLRLRERELRLRAETRIRQLEAENRRLRQEGL